MTRVPPIQLHDEEDNDGYKDRNLVKSDLLTWLPLGCTILLSALLSGVFKVPSTLFLYLAFIGVYSAMGVANVAGLLLLRRQNRKINRTVPIGIALVLLALPNLGHFTYIGGFGPIQAAPLPSHRNGVLFVAINLYNSEAVLPRMTTSLIDLARITGNSNIFISIYESNSVDSTKALLSTFDSDLEKARIPHHIQSVDTQDHIGVEGGYDRIKFLAGIRNKVYDVLEMATYADYKDKIDQVLWLNDVVFDAKAAIRLLNTNGGNYDAACGIDYIPIGMYDTWVLRDKNFKRPKPLWPYFQDPHDVDLLRLGLPIPVKSCWNGIVAFDANLLLDGRPRPGSPKKLSKKSNQSTVTWPLRFRESGSCLTSECLSLLQDLHLLLVKERKPLIFVNPTVQVAYDSTTFFLFTQLMKWHVVSLWHLIWEDWISNKIFGPVTDLGRKPAACREVIKMAFYTFLY